MTDQHIPLRIPEHDTRVKFIAHALSDPRYKGMSSDELGALHDLRSPSFAQRLFDIRNQHLSEAKESYTFSDVQNITDSVMTSVIQLVGPGVEQIDTKYQLHDYYKVPTVDGEGNTVYDHRSAEAEVSVLDYWALVNG